ncbi:unnamed protein product [Urochloa humidicola]
MMMESLHCCYAWWTIGVTCSSCLLCKHLDDELHTPMFGMIILLGGGHHPPDKIRNYPSGLIQQTRFIHILYMRNYLKQKLLVNVWTLATAH